MPPKPYPDTQVNLQFLEQAKSFLEDAHKAAQGSGNGNALSALSLAINQVNAEIAVVSSSQAAAMANALASGLNVFPNVGIPIPSRNELENKIKSLENSLKISQDNKSTNAENHKQLESALKELQQKLEENTDQINIAGGPFWFRRFHTSISIASAGAFLATGNKLFSNETHPLAYNYAFTPLTLFGLSLILSGVVPVAFFFKKNGIGWILAIVACIFFAAAIIACSVGALALSDAKILSLKGS